MRKSTIIVATLVSSLGLAVYQSIAVRGDEKRKIDVGEVVLPDDVKALAAEFEQEQVELERGELRKAPVAEDVGGLPLERRGGFVAVPSSAGKGAKTSVSSRGKSSSSKKVRKAPAVQKRGTQSMFRKETSAVSRELSRNFYKKTDFGFSARVKKTTKGKQVSVQRS